MKANSNDGLGVIAMAAVGVIAYFWVAIATGNVVLLAVGILALVFISLI